MSFALKLRRVVGSIAGLILSSRPCPSCAMPHQIARYHHFRVDCLFGSVRNFIAPCCRWCWHRATREERLTLAALDYGRLLSRGVTVEQGDWKQIRDAVLCDGLEDWAEIERIVRTPA